MDNSMPTGWGKFFHTDRGFGFNLPDDGGPDVFVHVHHAAADSYRRILDGVDPQFLLGLTATPDRADSADILGVFNDLVAFSAGIPRGVELGRLVPFHYFGVKDEIDYENIPWRNHRLVA